MPPVHRDTDLRFCGAATIALLQQTVFVNNQLAAVVGDINTHPVSLGSLASGLSGLGGLSGIAGLGSLTGLAGNLSGLSGLSSLGSLASVGNLASGISGLSSIMGNMGINMPSMISSMSQLGSLSGTGINISNVGDIPSIASSISLVTGIPTPGSSALENLNSLSSAVSGGLSNIGSLSSLANIAGIGSMGNYLNMAQGILGLGGNLGNLSNMMSSLGGLMGAGGLGQLISASPGTVLAQNIPMIASLMDQSAPDIIGLITHITNFPTPAKGSIDTFLYGGPGTFAGGLGIMNMLGGGGFGSLLNGEMVSMAGNVIGMVHNFTSLGGGQGLAIISGLNGGLLSSIPSAGSQVLGQTSGNSITFSSVES